MSTEGVAEFLEKLAVHFPIKHSTPEQRRSWVASMQHELRSFLPSELKEAAAILIRTRTHSSFPLPAACLEACEQARNTMAMHRRMQAGVPVVAKPMRGGALDHLSLREVVDMCWQRAREQAAKPKRRKRSYFVQIAEGG